MDVAFNGEPAIVLKTLTSAFNGLGYRIDIKSFSVVNGGGELKALGVGNRPFNPKAVGETLAVQGVMINTIRFDSDVFSITMNADRAIWNVPLLSSDEAIELKKTLSPQWFRVEEAQTIRVEPSYNGKWYPDVAVYDPSMHLLSSFRSLTPEDEFQFELPHGAYYLKISNVYGMKVLSEGMLITSLAPER